MSDPKKIRGLCDGYSWRGRRYPEIFFNRNWQSFASILHFHRFSSLPTVTIGHTVRFQKAVCTVHTQWSMRYTANPSYGIGEEVLREAIS
jgi:hypothetical protein